MSLSITGQSPVLGFLRTRVDRPMADFMSAGEMTREGGQAIAFAPFDAAPPAEGPRLTLLQRMCRAGLDATGVSLDDRAALEAMLAKPETPPALRRPGAMLDLKA